MPTLSLDDYVHARTRNYFEKGQEWDDTAQNRQLLAAYDSACEKSSSFAISSLHAEKVGWSDADQLKIKAGHWQVVVDTLSAVLSMEIDGGKTEILLPDPWE